MKASMLPDTFETDRLLLRPVTVANADAIFEAMLRMRR